MPTEGESARVTRKMLYGMTSWFGVQSGHESATKTTNGSISPPSEGQVEPVHSSSKQAPQPIFGCRVDSAASGFSGEMAATCQFG